MTSEAFIIAHAWLQVSERRAHIHGHEPTVHSDADTAKTQQSAGDNEARAEQARRVR